MMMVDKKKEKEEKWRTQVELERCGPSYGGKVSIFLIGRESKVEITTC
jgi:hypothetical protein